MIYDMPSITPRPTSHARVPQQDPRGVMDGLASDVLVVTPDDNGTGESDYCIGTYVVVGVHNYLGAEY